MKKLFTGITMLISLSASATIFYIDPHGSNTNNGTSTGTPWKTLTYACAHATTSGDIIHVNAGTYIETVQSVLAVGVSIEGEGVTSIIHSRISGTSIFTILLSSASIGTYGNQHISNIKMDGDTLNAFGAILVYQRSNVEIYNCIFKDFHFKGVGFEGYPNTGGGTGNSPPTTYATGNKFHDNSVINCSGYYLPGNKYNGTAWYALGIDGQDSLLAYNNNLDQTSRAIGYNGFLIKGVSGYNRNLKIHNNTLTTGPCDATSWDFAIELWDCRGGVEIYDNIITGSIDIGGYHTRKNSYAYAVYIHNNTIGQASLHDYEGYYGINFEGDIANVIIEKNLIKNVANGISFSQNGSARTVSNVSIRYNILNNIGITLHNGNGIGISWNANYSNNIVNDINIWNNVISSHVGTNISNLGICLPDIGTAKNVSVRNNIIMGFGNYPIYAKASAGQTIDNLSIENNIFYNNGKGNFPLYIAIIPTHNTTQNNLITNPLFVSSSDFHLQATSPAINSGIDVGLPYNGSAPDIGAYEYSNTSSPRIGVNAGNNTTLILPINNTTLTGSIVNPGGTINYVWIKISGPTSYNIINASSPITEITELVQGVYKFELKASDNKGETGLDTVRVTVNAAANIPSIANAGQDQTIILPTNTVSLSGSGTDTDGSIASYNWKKISGPSAGTITNTTSAATSVTGLVQGVYRFELKVTDNNGATGRDTMQITVDAGAAANIPPVANAGADQTITLPTNTASLNGSVTGADEGISSYSWTMISGPSADTITNTTSAATSVTGLVQGVYKFELKVTDNNGATGRDTMQITVDAGAAANIPPVANAGADQTITLPTNTTTLNGSGTDANGTITEYFWKQISGSSVSVLVSPNAATTFLDNLVPGTYEFELTVTDNTGAIGRDTVVLVVQWLKLDIQSNNIKIYPNPWVDTATLEINTTQANSKLLIVITNMQGQIAYKNELVLRQNNIKEKINMSNLSKGTYAVTVYFSDKEKQTIKVMKM